MKLPITIRLLTAAVTMMIILDCCAKTGAISAPGVSAATVWPAQGAAGLKSAAQCVNTASTDSALCNCQSLQRAGGLLPLVPDYLDACLTPTVPACPCYCSWNMITSTVKAWQAALDEFWGYMAHLVIHTSKIQQHAAAGKDHQGRPAACAALAGKTYALGPAVIVGDYCATATGRFQPSGFDRYQSYDIAFTADCNVTATFTPKSGANIQWPEAVQISSTSGWMVPHVDPSNALLGGTVVLHFDSVNGREVTEVMPLSPEGELMIEQATPAAACTSKTDNMAAKEAEICAKDVTGAKLCIALLPLVGFPRTKYMADWRLLSCNITSRQASELHSALQKVHNLAEQATAVLQSDTAAGATATVSPLKATASAAQYMQHGTASDAELYKTDEVLLWHFPDSQQLKLVKQLNEAVRTSVIAALGWAADGSSNREYACSSRYTYTEPTLGFAPDASRLLKDLQIVVANYQMLAVAAQSMSGQPWSTL